MKKVLFSLSTTAIFFMLMFTASPVESLATLFIAGVIPVLSYQIPADAILLTYAVVLTLALTSLAYTMSTRISPQTKKQKSSTATKSESKPALPKHRYTHAKSASSLTA